MHPEYPCAHCITASAVATVLESEFGAGKVSTIAMTTSTAPGVTRRWEPALGLREGSRQRSRLGRHPLPELDRGGRAHGQGDWTSRPNRSHATRPLGRHWRPARKPDCPGPRAPASARGAFSRGAKPSIPRAHGPGGRRALNRTCWVLRKRGCSWPWRPRRWWRAPKGSGPPRGAAATPSASWPPRRSSPAADGLDRDRWARSCAACPAGALRWETLARRARRQTRIASPPTGAAACWRRGRRSRSSTSSRPRGSSTSPSPSRRRPGPTSRSFQLDGLEFSPDGRAALVFMTGTVRIAPGKLGTSDLGRRSVYRVALDREDWAPPPRPSLLVPPRSRRTSYTASPRGAVFAINKLTG